MTRNGSMLEKKPMMTCEEVDREKHRMVFDIKDMIHDMAPMIWWWL